MDAAAPLAPPSDNPFAPTRLELNKSKALARRKWITLGFCLLLVAPFLAIIIDIFWKAAPVLSWSYLWENPHDSGKSGGLWAPLIGTFYLVLVSLLFVAPVGLLGAIYLNEYARDNWLSRSINIAVTSLAGVPSIVHGLFGLGAFVWTMLPAINGDAPPDEQIHAGLLTAALTIAVMNLPVIITSAREALSSVPMPFREACWNLGATRFQTIRTVVLPNSLSGMLTGVILEVCRCAGETAPILFTGATFLGVMYDDGWQKLAPYDLGEPFMALAMHLHIIANQISGMPEAMKYGAAAVMIGLVFFINSFAIGLRVWLRSRKRW